MKYIITNRGLGTRKIDDDDDDDDDNRIPSVISTLLKNLAKFHQMKSSCCCNR